MSLLAVDHVNLTIDEGAEALEQAKRFYGEVLGLGPAVRPEVTESGRPGAWYACGTQEVHLSAEAGSAERNRATRRHAAFRVADLDSLRARLAAAGFEPHGGVQFVGSRRFFVRDPFGNRLEFLERVSD